MVLPWFSHHCRPLGPPRGIPWPRLASSTSFRGPPGAGPCPETTVALRGFAEGRDGRYDLRWGIDVYMMFLMFEIFDHCMMFMIFDHEIFDHFMKFDHKIYLIIL